MLPDSYMPHVQGMFLATDKVGLKVGIEEGIFNLEDYGIGFVEAYKSKFDVIFEKEIGFSQFILQHGYNIGCLMSCYKNVDFRKGEPKFKGNDPWGKDSYFSCNLHPYELIFFKNNRGVEEKLIKNLITWNKL